MLAALDQAGLPVSLDHIGCDGTPSSAAIHCYGSSSDEPTAWISATFVPDAGRAACPGRLTIHYGPTLLASFGYDPCR